VWLAFLGPFFFASYGFANWLAGRSDRVGAVAFAWEHRIPFVPWTIVPYWSIDFLYVVSIFICTTRRELDRHALRLLFVQLVCVACFIAFPLRFTFTHPATSSFLFAALASFDKPFNQAPSLHIALLVLIWARLNAHTPRRWRWLLHAWMVLIGVSVLTTYQHHFIDIPTGLAVGLVALWFDVPLHLTGDRTRWRIAAAYALGAIVIASIALMGGAFLWFLWPAIALLFVALNYAFAGARGFQKRDDGRLSATALTLFAPYIAGAWINSRFWTRRHAAPCEVADGVFIGRIPSRRAPFDAIVDLCAELPCFAPPSADLTPPYVSPQTHVAPPPTAASAPKNATVAPGTQDVAEGGGAAYRSIPVLDLVAASEGDLRAAAAAIEEARKHGRVLVCCALGFSRSAAAIVAWLMTTHRAESLEAAMAMVRRARPAIVLRERHRAALAVLG
jgi:hypothetical protein